MKLAEVHPDTPTLDEIVDAVAGLGADSAARWGKMSAGEMLRHCSEFNRLCLGDHRPGFAIRTLARLLGPMFLRKLLRKPVTETPRNLGTLPVLRVESGSVEAFEAARDEFLESLERIRACPDGHRHPLYGELGSAELQGLVRHHCGHHANQFGLLESD